MPTVCQVKKPTTIGLSLLSLNSTRLYLRPSSETAIKNTVLDHYTMRITILCDSSEHFRNSYWNILGKFIDLNDSDCTMANLFGDCTWEVQPNLVSHKPNLLLIIESFGFFVTIYAIFFLYISDLPKVKVLDFTTHNFTFERYTCFPMPLLLKLLFPSLAAFSVVTTK
jgi:hypothetical protein